MKQDPNMRCTCGHRRFRETLARNVEVVSIWLPVAGGGGGGFGSSPYGTLLGGGDIGGWGRYDVNQSVTVKSTNCESCGRLRRSVSLGGTGVMGSAVLGNTVYIGVSYVGQLGCLSVRFEGETETLEVPPRVYVGVPPEINPGLPIEIQDILPPQAKTMQYLSVDVPEVMEDGLFTVSLVDRCAGTAVVLFNSLYLESTMQSFTPKDAELNGLNETVADRNLRGLLPANQPSSGSVRGIAFDKCDGVIEYDARRGTLPGVQGWTHQGAGNSSEYSLSSGGVLSYQTATDDSYWTKELELSQPATQVFSYARYMLETGSLDISAEAAEAGSDYWGTALRASSVSVRAVELDGGGTTAIGDKYPGWSDLFSGLGESETDGSVVLDSTVYDVTATEWGILSPGPADHTLRATFGDTQGSNLTGRLRNVVVSASGLFTRAFFRAFAPTAAPALRLYFVCDSDSVGGSTARVRVRYGALGPGSNPYELGTQYVDTTVSVASKNVTLEAVMSLTGLTAKTPFWFSVERVWDHADDSTRASIHLTQCTIRNQ